MKIRRTEHLKAKPDLDGPLGFGQYFTDHMATAYYRGLEQGWEEPEIVPYGPFSLDPAASVLHYGQAIFEGMKAFKQEDGRVVLFRPAFNWQRMKKSAERLCMEFLDEESFIQAIADLVRLDHAWIPTRPGASLYIRPTLLGIEPFLGVRPSNRYLFYVILSPVGAYYREGWSPLRIWVEQEYLRAAPGGLGETKAAANYAGSLKAAQRAKEKGFSQVLWLDVSRQYIEEVGTMNVFFVFADEVVTPQLSGTILGGGMRDAVLTILREWDLPVRERQLSLNEILQGQRSGRLKEAFGTGTAAVISPIGELAMNDTTLQINGGKTGELAARLYEEIVGIQMGRVMDRHRWLMALN